jgi:hypothetical protein
LAVRLLLLTALPGHYQRAQGLVTVFTAGHFIWASPFSNTTEQAMVQINLFIIWFYNIFNINKNPQALRNKPYRIAACNAMSLKTN